MKKIAPEVITNVLNLEVYTLGNIVWVYFYAQNAPAGKTNIAKIPVPRSSIFYAPCRSDLAKNVAAIDKSGVLSANNYSDTAMDIVSTFCYFSK